MRFLQLPDLISSDGKDMLWGVFGLARKRGSVPIASMERT
jgi:hypothetical protein